MAQYKARRIEALHISLVVETLKNNKLNWPRQDVGMSVPFFPNVAALLKQ